MVPFWPDIAKNNSAPTEAMNEFARAFDDVPEIVVFSRTLQTVDDKRTRIVRTDPIGEIRKLKQGYGKAILLGGVDIPTQLVIAGLVDEYVLVVQPLIAGKSRRLLQEVSLPESLQLELVDSKILKSGDVALRYVSKNR